MSRFAGSTPVDTTVTYRGVDRLVVPGAVDAVQEAARGRVLFELMRHVRCPDSTVGTRRGRPHQVIVLRDRSGSTSWSDPHGVTAGSSRTVARYLAEWGRGRQPDDYAAAQFDHTCEITMSFTPAPKAARKVKPFWPAPRGGTDIPLALHTVADAADAYGRYPTRVILITDGAGGSHSDLAMALARFDPGAVHLVLVDQGGGWPHVAAIWNGLPLGSVSVIDDQPLDPVVCTHTIGEAAAVAIGASFRTRGQSVFDNNPTGISIHTNPVS